MRHLQRPAHLRPAVPELPAHERLDPADPADLGQRPVAAAEARLQLHRLRHGAVAPEREQAHVRLRAHVHERGDAARAAGEQPVQAHVRLAGEHGERARARGGRAREPVQLADVAAGELGADDVRVRGERADHV
jgi:hypothetical protein